MVQYKEMNSIFSELKKHVVSSKAIVNSPQRNDSVLIITQILETLDDGMVIELCLWRDSEYHISFWDVSVNKNLFSNKSKTDLTSYLESKGIYLGNVKDKFGKWKYSGPIETNDVYRIQYYEDDEN